MGSTGNPHPSLPSSEDEDINSESDGISHLLFSRANRKRAAKTIYDCLPSARQAACVVYHDHDYHAIATAMKAYIMGPDSSISSPISKRTVEDTGSSRTSSDPESDSDDSYYSASPSESEDDWDDQPGQSTPATVESSTAKGYRENCENGDSDIESVSSGEETEYVDDMRKVMWKKSLEAEMSDDDFPTVTRNMAETAVRALVDSRNVARSMDVGAEALKSEVPKKLGTVVTVSPREILEKMKLCRKCTPPRGFEDRQQAKAHFASKHGLRFCPVCFDLLPIIDRGERYLAHLVQYHILSSGTGNVKCIICQEVIHHSACYQHVSVKHLKPIEEKDSKLIRKVHRSLNFVQSKGEVHLT